MSGPDQVLKFWLDEVGPDGWYRRSDDVDAAVRDRFMDTWQGATDGKFSLWLTHPTGVLAYIIVMDQFPRNMFRDSGKSFASDRAALASAKTAIDKRWDLRIDEPARHFFYIPLEHSENLYDQDRCVRLMHERLPEQGAEYLLHARAHRAVIRQFGRFPHRNAMLGRTSTQSETEYVANGGYGALLRSLQGEKAA